MSPDEVKKFLSDQKEKAVRGFNLFNGIKVRLISKEDIEDLRRQPLFLPPNLSELISPQMFVLERKFKAKKGVGFDYHKPMQSIILSLRLLKKGVVFGSYVLNILVSNKRQLDSWSYEEDRPRTSFEKYFLDIKELPKLRKIIRKIVNIDPSKRKSLDLACKRFQRAYEEKAAEDQLIDLMIAFEALFLKGEKKIPAKGKMIAIACSTLLGKDEEERDEIKRILNDAYSIRNCIVHGSEFRRFESDGKGNLLFDTLPDLVSDVEDCLRESIKKLLD